MSLRKKARFHHRNRAFSMSHFFSHLRHFGSFKYINPVLTEQSKNYANFSKRTCSVLMDNSIYSSGVTPERIGEVESAVDTDSLFPNQGDRRRKRCQEHFRSTGVELAP